MKKLLLFLFLITAGFATESKAQFQFGAGIDLWLEGETTIGVQGKAIYGISDKLAANGSFSYYLSDFLDYSIDLAVQYSVIEGESFTLAPLAGFDITRASFAGFGSTNTALQIGAFMTVPVSGLSLYIEPKLIIDDGSGLVISAGILF